MLVKNIVFIPKGVAYLWRGTLQCPFANSIVLLRDTEDPPGASA